MEKIKFNNLPNLLTLSGKAGSGKDTVERIIQAFTTNGVIDNPDEIRGELGYEMLENEDTLKSVINGNLFYGLRTYTNRKFADKLKDIVCLLINCSRSDLEDRDFKEKPLGEDWLIWKLELTDSIEFDVNYLTDGGIFVSKEEAETFIKEHNISNVDKIYSEELTPRLLLQLIGTECGRQIIHPNVWVNSLFSEYQPLPKFKSYELNTDDISDYFNSYTVLCHTCDKRFNSKNKRALMCGSCVGEQEDEYPRWIITDVRFPNEVNIVKNKGGVRIRVNRPPIKRTSQKWQELEPEIIVMDPDGWNRDHRYQFEWFEELITYDEYCNRRMRSTCMCKGGFGDLVPKKPHESEIALDDYDEWDYVIENDGTLRDLVVKVYEMLVFLNKK